MNDRRAHAVLASAMLAAALAVSGCSASSGKTSADASVQASAAAVPTVETVRIALRPFDFVVKLPGELRPYEAVAVYPKVSGFVKSIAVDRGSHITKGQLLAQIDAPELVLAQSEAAAKLASVEHQRAQAEAKLVGDRDTYKRLKVAAATPGVISDNELETAEKIAEADEARVMELANAVSAAAAALHAARVMKGYLEIRAPFTGVVTTRNVHPGALVGPAGSGKSQAPMLQLEQNAVLRLVVAVPEAYAAGVVCGARVAFSVPAFPGRTFTGTVARISDSLDPATRTMPVELDVPNAAGELAPGMFPTVSWPVHRPQPSLLVPESAVVRTSQRTFVIRVRNGVTEWVTVIPGMTSGDEMEVFGDLKPRDEVVRQATEELQPNTRVDTRAAHASS